MNFLLAAIEKPFIPGWATPGEGLRPFAAELVIIGTIIAVLVAPFFTRRSNALCGAISIVGLLIAEWRRRRAEQVVYACPPRQLAHED